MHRKLTATTIAAMFVVATLLPTLSAAADFGVHLPMARAATGSYEVTGRFDGGLDATFLVDTGAGISVIEKKLLRVLKRQGTVSHSRRIAARFANGRVETVEVYRVDGLTLGTGCSVGSIELAVMSGGGNILGLNALEKLAPFALHVSPPALAVSGCSAGDLLALNDAP